VTISPQRRQEIIDALRRGTVPRMGLDAFAVNLDRFEATLDEELARVKAGGSVFKAVQGEYGHDVLSQDDAAQTVALNLALLRKQLEVGCYSLAIAEPQSIGSDRMRIRSSSITTIAPPRRCDSVFGKNCSSSRLTFSAVSSCSRNTIREGLRACVSAMISG
jgi:hypothetical protein